MTIIKIPIPKTDSMMEVVVAVDVYGMDGSEQDDADAAVLGLERMVGLYLKEMFKKIGVNGLEFIQD